jgi:hypothetical protein
MSALIDLKGERFTRLTVLKYAGSVKGAPKWLCKCDCGKEVEVFGQNLRSCNTQSCGCYRKGMHERARR